MARFHSDLLRSVRLDLGMSQDEAARLLRVDVRTYRRYESGAVNESGDFEIRNASRRQLLRRMCKELGVADEDAWLVPTEATATATTPTRRANIGTALQRATHFVGREDVLTALARFLEDDRTWVFVLVGVGGAGKTSVIERFIHARSTKETSTWVHSFYDDPRSEAVVEELSRTTTSTGSRATKTKTKTNTKNDTTPQVGLVVLDGLETVQSEGGDGRAFGELDDPALRRVLRAACAGLLLDQRKVIVTSRFPMSDFAAWEGNGLTTFHLAPLSHEETTELLRAWGMNGDDAVLAPIRDRTGGHALSVAMLGSYVATFLGGDPERVATAGIPDDAASDDHTARRLTSVLDSYAGSLSDRERDLLARLSLFAGAADVPLLAIICSSARKFPRHDDAPEPNEDEILRTVARLARLGLVAQSPRGGVTAHPFVRDHFKRLLDVPEAEVHEVMRDALAASLEGKPTSYVRDPDLLDRYETLFTHTLRSGRPREAWGIYTHALGGFSNLGLRIGAMTRGARVLSSFSERAGGGRASSPKDSTTLRAFSLPSDLDGETRAHLLYEWGLYAGALGDLVIAAHCHDAHLRALEDVEPLVARARRAMGLRTRAYVAWLAGELEAARDLLDASLTAARLIEDERGVRFHLLRTHALNAMVAHDAGDADAATRSLTEAHAIEPVPTSRRALWEAEIHLARGDKQHARDLATSAMTECARLGWVGHVAHAHTVLGLAWVEDAPATAKKHLENALPWVRASNEVEVALRCHHLGARAERSGSSTRTNSSSSAVMGQALAETHGFAIFARRFAKLH